MTEGVVFLITDKLTSLTVTDGKTHFYHLFLLFLKSFGKVLGKSSRMRHPVKLCGWLGLVGELVG